MGWGRADRNTDLEHKQDKIRRGLFRNTRTYGQFYDDVLEPESVE